MAPAFAPASGRPGYVRPLAAFLASAAVGLPLFLLRDGQTNALKGTRVAAGLTVFRMEQGGLGVRVIEADLEAGVRVEVAADEIAVRQGRITGRARTLPQWLRATGAAAGVNGGFFGATVDEEHEEIVGLLKRAGRVRVAAQVYRSRPRGTRYARSALGLTARGRPDIQWATSRPGDPQALRSHPEPEFSGSGSVWKVREALGCGPRLIHGGEIAVASRAERLASPGALRRTFAGYGGPGGKPRYLVLCAARGMAFEECAAFLMRFFRQRHELPCREGMCLDGGGSTQAAWRAGEGIHADPDPGTPVPTALLLYSK
jgi:hypothetical protein